MRTPALVLPALTLLFSSIPAFGQDASPSTRSDPGTDASKIPISERIPGDDILFDVHGNLAGLAQWGLTMSAEVGTDITGLMGLRLVFLIRVPRTA